MKDDYGEVNPANMTPSPEPIPNDERKLPSSSSAFQDPFSLDMVRGRTKLS